MAKVVPLKIVSQNDNVFRVTLKLNWKHVGAETYVGKLGKWTAFIISLYGDKYHLTTNLPGTTSASISSSDLAKLMLFSKKNLGQVGRWLRTGAKL